MIQNLTAIQAQEVIARGDVDVVDVREDSEWAVGHLPGSRHVPLARLRDNLASELTRDGVIFVCAAGVRSLLAARLAERVGLKQVFNLAGGTRAWSTAGLPLVRDTSAAA
jgi:rhodanese-related sulfurtransferase